MPWSSEIGRGGVRIHLWSTPLLSPPPTIPLKKQTPSLPSWAPSSPPQPHGQQHSELGEGGPILQISRKAHRTLHLAVEFLLSQNSAFITGIFPTQQPSADVLVLKLYAPHAVAALVFSLCISGSVFPLADLCLGAAKIKRAFWCRPGCLSKWRNAAQSSAP